VPGFGSVWQYWRLVRARYDALVSESLVPAFPPQLAQVAARVAGSLPPGSLPPAGSVTETHSRSWPGLTVDGEPVVIPYRIYNPELPRPGGMNGTAELVAAALYTRHHDGRVRQRHLGTLLAADQPWAAPFVIALLGEYVTEICHDIERFTQAASPPSPLCRHLTAFLAANPSFAELTRQRALSYWSCYHRSRYPSPGTYPALAALSALVRGE
jgi:hypothetical protein